MRVRLILMLFFIIFAFSSPGFGADRIKVVGALCAPFFTKEPSGYQGFDVDLLEIMLKGDIEFKVVPFKEALRLVAEGKADIAIGGIYVTPERARLFNYTKPYLKTGLVMVVPSKSLAKGEEDFKGKRICVKISATGESRALKLKSRMGWTIVRKVSTKDCFEALLKGEADALYNDYYNSVYLINKFYIGKLRILRDVWGPIFFEKAEIAFPVAKGRKDLLFKLNEGIRELKRREILNYLVSKWFNIPFMAPAKSDFFKAFSMGAVLILIIAGGGFSLFYYRRKKQELAFFKEYLEVLPAAVMITEKDGKVIFANDKAMQLLNEIEESKLTQEPDIVWLSVRDKRLNERFFLRFVVPIGSKLCYFFADITEFKKLQEEREALRERLLSVQKLEGLGRITYQLAHDFNSVLSSILSSVELALIKLQEEDKSEVKKQLEDVRKRVLAFSEFARKILSFAREPVRETSPIDVNHLVSESEYIIRSILGKVADVEIELGEVRLAQADPSALFQILLNLATNARDAFVELGRPIHENKVKIKTYMAVADEDELKEFPWAEPGSYVVIEFSDNGPGIPKALLNKVFEPFFTTKVGSTGVGLFVVQELIKFMKGFLKVKTEEGKGTTFLIYLPMAH